MHGPVWPMFAAPIVMLLVILLSLAGVARIVVLVILMRRGRLLPSLVVSRLQQLLSAGEIEEAKELCIGQSSLCNVLFAGLSRIEEGPESASRAAELAAKKEGVLLRQRVGRLPLVAILALLLGTLGAAIDINLTLYHHANFQWLALPGTAAAAVFFCAWWFFRNRAETLAHEIEKTADDLISRVGTDLAGEEQAKTES